MQTQILMRDDSSSMETYIRERIPFIVRGFVDAAALDRSTTAWRVNGFWRETLELEVADPRAARLYEVLCGNTPGSLNKVRMFASEASYETPNHYDLHCLSFLNVVLSGRKRWRIQSFAGTDPRTRIPFTYSITRFDPSSSCGFVLEPGDLLYLPPGYYHEVATEGPARMLSLASSDISGCPRAMVTRDVSYQLAFSRLHRGLLDHLAGADSLARRFSQYYADYARSYCGHGVDAMWPRRTSKGEIMARLVVDLAALPRKLCPFIEVNRRLDALATTINHEAQAAAVARRPRSSMSW